MEYKVTLPYIGGILTDNNYKIGKSKKTRPMVSMWMSELAEKVRELNIPVSENYEISLYGRFWDERHPDLANLHKVVGDSIKKVLIDDKYFIFRDKGLETGKLEQELDIYITPIEENKDKKLVTLEFTEVEDMEDG